MATHSSAPVREQEPHAPRTPYVNQTPHANRTTRTATINRALRERAQEVLSDKSIDGSSDSGSYGPNSYAASDDGLTGGGPSAPRMEALVEMICGAGDESAGALFVLMGTLQHSNEAEVLANTVKHLAFTRCGELNLFGMVDAQIAAVENELFAGRTTVS